VRWCCLVQVSGHFDYAKQMDAVLEMIGIRTREHAELGAVDSLRQWSAVQQYKPSATSSVACSSPMTDSALGDEVEEAIEATEYINVAEDDVHS